MRVRVIRLANNFYKDEEQKKRNAGGLSDNPNRRQKACSISGIPM